MGLAGSFLAGFPETFAIDTLFVAVWAVARMAGPGRRHLRAMAAKLAAAAAAAVALALPLVVAFLGYLGFADTGSHGSGGFAFVTLRARDLAQLVLPYSAGPIDAFHTPGPVDTINVFWGNVGGYLDATLLAAACVGAIGRRNRILRLVLVAWVVVCLARTYGFPPAVHLLAAVPGLRLTAFYRYADPTWELAAVVLAVLGLDDIARRRTRFRWLVGAAAAVAAASVGAALVARSTLDAAVGPTGSMELHRHRFATGSLAFALGALTLMTIGGWLAAGRPSLPAHGAHRRDDLARRRWGRVAMAAAVSVESLVLLGFTYLSAPVPVTADTASVTWLPGEPGTYRFATLGPIQPNYGSYYRIAEVNVNELPLPRAWTAYVATRLDPNIVPFEFTGGYSAIPRGRPRPRSSPGTCPRSRRWGSGMWWWTPRATTRPAAPSRRRERHPGPPVPGSSTATGSPRSGSFPIRHRRSPSRTPPGARRPRPDGTRCGSPAPTRRPWSAGSSMRRAGRPTSEDGRRRWPSTGRGHRACSRRSPSRPGRPRSGSPTCRRGPGGRSRWPSWRGWASSSRWS